MIGRRSISPADSIEEIASVIERLAVLIGAGVAPRTAWVHVAERTANLVVARAAEAALDGRSVGGAIAHACDGAESRAAEAWRAVAASWAVASECGSPLAASLREMAETFRSLGQTQREMEAARAGPRATARLVTFLPLVGVLFGVLMGFDTLGTLFRTVPGWVCIAVGGALMAAGARWNHALIARAQPRVAAPGIGIDLMIVALSGGSSIDRARAIVQAQIDRYRLSETEADATSVASVVALASAAGAPAADLLRSEASMLRRRARLDGQAASAVLAVRLMIPLALCFLPAFLALGVMPVVIAVLSSTVSAL
jgi:tight adherence protein B